MNEILNIHQDFVDLPLKKFNASEIDILMAICYKCQDKECNEVTLNLDDIKKLADYKAKDEKQFLKSVDKTNEKLLSLNFKIGNERVFSRFVLFPQFDVNADKGTLKVKVNEPFAYILNDLNFYTSLELQESSSLKSGYSKQIYKKLKRFKTTGIWIVKIDDFKEYLDIPKSYRVTNIDQFVINPTLEELSPYFEGLKVTKQYKKSSSGKGRPSVVGYEFTFKQQLQKEKPALSDNFKRTGRICSVCGRGFVEIPTNDKSRVFFGHTNFDREETGCDLIYKTISELDGQLPESKKEEVSSEEAKRREENKKKINSIFGKLFK